MQPINELLKGFQKTVVDNSPALLTAFGVTGTISTAMLAGRASFSAAEVIRMAEEQGVLDGRVEKTLKERTLLVWKLYIPAAATGITTVACIVGANHISSKRSAALVTAYSLTERAFGEYKEKVIEQFGVNKETKVRDAIAQDRVDRTPASSTQVIITDNGDVLCYETMSGRYFKSSMEALRRGQNDVNAQILNEMYASLNDFCRAIGLPVTGYGEEVGWTSDRMLELQFSTVLSEDSKPCLAIGYKELPFPKYDRFG